MIAALVALKDLSRAKSRLTALLRPDERKSLVRAMATDVLSVLSNHPELDRVVVVSDDTEVAALAREAGVVSWSEQALGVRGLNPVLQSASARLLAQGVSRLLVLHADLPLLRAEDIDAVIALLRADADQVIAPDRHGSGTNLLAGNAGAAPRFQFGPGSRARHTAAAAAAGWHLVQLHRVGLAGDVDEPADLAWLLSALAGEDRLGHTARWLYHSAEGARVRRALAPWPVAEDVGKGIGIDSGSNSSNSSDSSDSEQGKDGTGGMKQ